jgi:phosphoribosylformimino-5-aminoimidazole carboxamide ribotide isomerase
VSSWIVEFGPERVGLAIDVRLDDDGVPRVQTRGWLRSTPATLWDTVERFVPQGLRHVLCTDIARDGALQGPNLALYTECARRFPAIAWQASGGVRDATDLEALAVTGATAAVSGKALLEGRFDEAAIRRWVGP